MIAYNHRKGHGRALKLIRERHGLTQKELGRVLKVNKARISQWELDKESMTEPMMLAYGSLARRAGLHSIARVIEAA